MVIAIKFYVLIHVSNKSLSLGTHFVFPFDDTKQMQYTVLKYLLLTYQILTTF